MRPAVERALSDSLGTNVRLEPGAEILRAMTNGYARVARFRVASGDVGAASVVVKRPGDRAPYDPDSHDGPAWGIFNEWAALEMLNAADASIAPRLLAADRALGVLVFEDLGDGDGIADLLLGEDPSLARDGLVGFARTLGRMHSVTAPLAAAYDSARRALGPLPDDDRYFAFRDFIRGFYEAYETLGLNIADPARVDAEAAIDAIRNPGSFRVYSHGDPCPDNTRIVDGRVVLIDFEVGGFRHALLDGTYGRVPFPTCWCVNRIPSDIVEDMESAYRSQLVSGVPAADDDTTFADAMLNAMAFWAIATTGWHVSRVLDADEEMHRGVHTRRQGVTLRWEMFVSAAETHGRLEHLAASGRQVLDTFRARWPETPPIPLYPAFR